MFYSVLKNSMQGNLLLKMSLFLILALLFFAGCIPDPYGALIRPYYTQQLEPKAWSDNGESLYLSYINRSGEALDFNFFFLEVDLETGHVDYLHKLEGIVPRILGSGFVANSMLFYTNANKDGFHLQELYQMDANAVQPLFSDSSITFYGAHSAYVKGNFLISSFSSRDNNNAVEEPQWGIYDTLEGTASLFRVSPEVVTPLNYLNPLGAKCYLSNVLPGARPLDSAYKDLQVTHALAIMDIDNVVISGVQKMPVYDGHLRFRDWLSEDEILFSQVRENGSYLQSVSYQISTQAYRVREDFRQQGLLSPDKSKVAFIDGDFLMISNADGSQARKILYIPRDLPKGDPEILE